MKVQIIDNKGDNTLKNVLVKQIKKGSKVAIASSYFSIYAYEALMKQLESVDDFKFLYTAPTFLKTDNEKKRKYHLEKMVESSYPKFDGKMYEIKLRNELKSPAIAKLAAEWIRKKATFKTVRGSERCPSNMIIQHEKNSLLVQSEVEFTAEDLGVTESNRLMPITAIEEDQIVDEMMIHFNNIWRDEQHVEDVTEQVIQQIETLYQENSPEWIYYVTLYHIFFDQLDSLKEENVLREGTGFKDTVIWNKLYPFQRDGVLGIIDKIEKHNGCILADSVGLGKTFSALAVIKYYELRQDRVLVLAPKKLRDNWTVYTQNDRRNILSDDRFNYDVLNHTDLSRESGKSGEIDLSTIHWGNYDLVVIDESHNFRNNNPKKDRKTRYQKLMQDIIKSGVQTKVLLLSATPVNNKMNDIKNQIAFITEDNPNAFSNDGIENINDTLRIAQSSYNRWMKLPAEERTTESFLETVNTEYFQLLDLISIARSRKHIEKYYDLDEVGAFPERRKPISIKSNISTKKTFYTLAEVNEKIERLSFGIYQPMKYILPQKRSFYEEKYDTKVQKGSGTFKQVDREYAIAALMKTNIFKRLESSIHSFNLTILRLMERMFNTIQLLSEAQDEALQSWTEEEVEETDDPILETMTVGTDKVRIQLADIDRKKWLDDLNYDLNILQDIAERSFTIYPPEDAKLKDLKGLIQKKIEQPLNKQNKKILIFSAYADTAKYLYDSLAEWIQDTFNLHSALVVGSGKNETTLKSVRVQDIDDILVNFSPISKEREKIRPNMTEEIDILFATDCISEGQNLQDCDYVVNYDIHWNPVRVIQRFGRIDRIGSTNKQIQLVNFWPNLELDEYINLEERVKGRMKLLNTSATGEEDIFEADATMNDLEYRKNQLKALQEEVVDLEDLNGAISITNLTFNEFKSDLTMFLKHVESRLQRAPKGMYAVTSNEKLREAPPGVIFCLRQVTSIDTKRNAIAPYILIYLTNEGECFLHYTQAKKVLDYYRRLTVGYESPLPQLVERFNLETKEGQDMTKYTKLLHDAFEVIQGKQEQSSFDSFFTPGGTNAELFHLEEELKDVELISFLVIEGEDNDR